MMVATAPGGGVDLIGRLVARHLQNHIPGKPTIVVQNVPGAGGNADGQPSVRFRRPRRHGDRRAAQRHADRAAADSRRCRVSIRRNSPGSAACTASNNVAYVWHTSPVQSLEELKTKEVIIGTSGPGSGSYDLSILAREVLGLKYRIVRGYKSAHRDQHRHGARRDPCPDRRLGSAQGAAAGMGPRQDHHHHRALQPRGPAGPASVRPDRRSCADRIRPPGAAAWSWPGRPTAARISCRPACRLLALRRCAAPSTRPCATPLSSRKQRR